jgi:membrane-bound lytic murein transglycosylase A
VGKTESLNHPAGRRGASVSRRMRLLGGPLSALIALASCAPKTAITAPPPPLEEPAPTPVPPPLPPPPPPANALAAGVTPGPALTTIDAVAAERAFKALQISCPVLTKRADPSGLIRKADWAPICNAVHTIDDPAFYADFFLRNFELAQVGDGKAFVTGYYEPQIRASRTRMPGYEVPIYARPADLLDVDPTTGQKRRGRLVDGQYVLYFDRTEIENGALAGRGLEIAWAADPIELFFLQIQGSGRLLLPDGSVIRIGYASQNGREYVGIGKLMKDRGLLGPGQTTMQGIVGWLRAHPEEGREIMRENKSYIFFSELTGPGPLGALGVPVTPRGTVAADPKYTPLGAPVLLELDRPEASGLWVAQDTGGAIRGTNRFDTFWGAGEAAAVTAGGMQGKGRAWILLPKGTVARINAAPQP